MQRPSFSERAASRRVDEAVFLEKEQMQWDAQTSRWKRWMIYAGLGLLGALAFGVNSQSRIEKERAIRYSECLKAQKGTPEQCTKIAAARH
jgi:hypothetical protein